MLPQQLLEAGTACGDDGLAGGVEISGSSFRLDRAW